MITLINKKIKGLVILMKNKVAFITGSAKGIGKGIAYEFAKNGYKVVINCKNSLEKMNETAEELKQYTEVMAVQADLSDYETAKKVIDDIVLKFGHIDVLVNNAGISYIGLFNTMKPDEWHNIMNNNLNTVFNCTHCALQYMVSEHRGTIINISSMWGQLGGSCEAVYSASKGGINSFTKALGKELALSGIKVNAISCGAIDTEMNSFLSEQERLDLENEIPAGRFGTVEEVGKLALFLASENSNYINGQIISIDGGMS